MESVISGDCEIELDIDLDWGYWRDRGNLFGKLWDKLCEGTKASTTHDWMLLIVEDRME